MGTKVELEARGAIIRFRCNFFAHYSLHLLRHILISKNLEFSNLLSFRKNLLRILYKNFVNNYESRTKTFRRRKKLSYSYRVNANFSGWTNNLQLLKRLDRDVKRKYYKRRDLNNVQNAKNFKIKITPDNAKYDVALCELIHLSSLSPVPLRNFYTSNIIGYFDGLTIDLKINFKLLRIFRDLQNFIFLKKFINVCQYWNFLNLKPDETEILFHDFHENIYDKLSEEFKDWKVLIPLLGLNLSEFFFSNISIESKSQFFCAKCRKKFELSFLEIYEALHLDGESNTLDAVDELNTHWRSVMKVKIDINKFVSTDAGKLVFVDPGIKNTSKFVSDLGRYIIFNNSTDCPYILIRKVKRNSYKIKSAILFSLSNQNNWYHAVVESLTLLPFLENEAGTGTVLLIPTGTNANIIELIKLICEYQIVFIDPTVNYHIDKLFIARKASWINDTPIDPYCKVEYHLDPHSILNFRILLWQKLAITQFNEHQLKRNISFLRAPLNSTSKILVNYSETVSILQSNGFEIYDSSLLSFSQQFKICQSAKNLVVQGGSGVVSMLFVQPGTKVFILNSYRAKHWAIFRHLARILDLELVEIFSKPSLPNMFLNVLDAVTRPYKSNSNSLKAYLSRI